MAVLVQLYADVILSHLRFGMPLSRISAAHVPQGLWRTPR
jgi:hypothetical protein